MKILADIASELRGMFLSDVVFSAAILCVVGIVSLLAGANSWAAGAVLILGCLLVLVWGCLSTSRSRRAPGADSSVTRP